MIHPLIRLLATEPQLLAEHVGAYAALVNSEARQASRQWIMRLLLGALALCCIGIAAVLGGVALMLWAITPGLSDEAKWALAAAPAVPAITAIVAGFLARRSSSEKAFASIQAQVAADFRMLSEARSSAS